MKNSKQSKIIGVIILLALIFLLPLLAMGQEADSVVMLTGDTFHVGNTSVSYEVAQRRNGRLVTFNMFGLDRFMDLKSFKRVARRHSREVQKQAWIEYKNSDHPFNSKFIRSGKPPGLYLLFDVLEKYGADYLQADTLACIYDTHGPIGHCELYLYDSESHSYHVFRRSGKGIQSEQYTGGETWYDDTPRMLLDMFRAKKYGELLNPDNYNNLILDSLGGYTIEVFIKDGKSNFHCPSCHPSFVD